jgi:hypothetical protein
VPEFLDQHPREDQEGVSLDIKIEGHIGTWTATQPRWPICLSTFKADKKTGIQYRRKVKIGKTHSGQHRLTAIDGALQVTYPIDESPSLLKYWTRSPT